MKIIFDNQSNDSIKLEDITKYHIVVASIGSGNRPAILSAKDYDSHIYKFLCINSGFTYCNGWSKSGDSSLQDMINFIKKSHSHCRIEVFEQKDWKKALQWLIDNCN